MVSSLSKLKGGVSWRTWLHVPRFAWRSIRLLSFGDSEPVTQEMVWERLSKLLPGALHHALIARDPEGAGIGFAAASREPHEPRGHFELEIVVDPAFRRRGTGATLCEQAVDWARARDGTTLSARVRDDARNCLAFATKRGFAIEAHRYEMALDLKTVSPEPFHGRVYTLRADGIRFFSLAETNSSETMLRRLDDLNTVTGQDIPGSSSKTLGYRPKPDWYRLRQEIIT